MLNIEDLAKKGEQDFEKDCSLKSDIQNLIRMIEKDMKDGDIMEMGFGGSVPNFLSGYRGEIIKMIIIELKKIEVDHG